MEQIPQIPEKRDVNFYLKECVEVLKGAFGVENLSNNELFILRKITEDVVNRIEKGANEGSDLAIINPFEEIPTRFLLEAYGIDVYHMQKNTETEEDREGFIEYIRRTRERAHLN